MSDNQQSEKNNLNMVKDHFRAMGMNEESSTEMALAVLKTSSDMASITGMGQKEAIERIQSTISAMIK